MSNVGAATAAATSSSSVICAALLGERTGLPSWPLLSQLMEEDLDYYKLKYIVKLNLIASLRHGGRIGPRDVYSTGVTRNRAHAAGRGSTKPSWRRAVAAPRRSALRAARGSPGAGAFGGALAAALRRAGSRAEPVPSRPVPMRAPPGAAAAPQCPRPPPTSTFAAVKCSTPRAHARPAAGAPG